MNMLLAPVPRRKRATVYTLVASLLLHGSIVGVAALWTSQPEPVKTVITVLEDAPAATAEVPEIENSGLPAFVPEPIAPVPEEIPAPMDDSLPTPEQPEIVEPATPKTVFKHENNWAKSTVHAFPTAGSPASASGLNRLTGTSGVGRVVSTVRWNVSSTPVYPYALRKAQIQGMGSVRVNTDATGRVESAVMIRSTGSPALDDNTCRHAKADWSGPANASIVVPVTYRIR